MSRINSKYKNNYLHDLKKCFYVNGYIDSYRLTKAIRVIEMENRRSVWRFCEYIICGFELLFRRNKVTDYSIGKYQMKISLLLDYYGVRYKKTEKTLCIENYNELSSKLNLILECNNEHIVYKVISVKFEGLDLNNLTDSELHDIALFYSRNVAFQGDLNYYEALKFLYRLPEKPSANTATPDMPRENQV